MQQLWSIGLIFLLIDSYLIQKIALKYQLLLYMYMYILNNGEYFPYWLKKYLICQYNTFINTSLLD